MLVLLLLSCAHQRSAAASWTSFDPDERRPVASGHLPFRGELEVGATYEAFAALAPGSERLQIVASRYSPQYFPGTIHWRNGEEALRSVAPGEWQAVVFDVVTVTESVREERGSITWVPVYECELAAVVPVPGQLASRP
jgi:hypothetical protein